MTIATIRPDGYPQATTVSYVNDGLTIYFGTGTDAQKARNIAANDRLSVTINRPYEDWDHIVGLSIGGRVSRIGDPEEFGKIGRLMHAKFPQIAQYAAAEDAGDMLLFRLDPEYISLLDYTRGFGHTEYYEVGDGKI